MKRRLTTLLLVLVMTLSMFTLPALAANNLTLSLNKTSFDLGEGIEATVSGISENPGDNIILYLCKPSDPLDKYQVARWIVGTGSFTATLNAPTQEGTYELRLFSDGRNPSAATLVTKVEITVGTVAKQGKISIDAEKYTVGGEITVTVTGITAQMKNTEAFVAIYKKGAEHSKMGAFAFLPEGSSVQKLNVPFENGEYEMRLYSTYRLYTDDTFIMAVPFTVSGASSWASDTLQKADDMGLIPDSLKGADLTKPITRKEFAAVAVKTYENLTGKTTTPVAKNPFTDTNDTEVLKAYNVGITSGTAADKFSPDVLLNREQAATMLTRVLKAAYITGWTGATDANYTLGFTQPAKFADDDKISDWAKPSVYFMAANGIISGTGNNMFSPRAVTTAEQAANYASATREQALVIAVRMVENLKGKPLDYKESTAQEPTTPTTPEPTKPSGDKGLTDIPQWDTDLGVGRSYMNLYFNSNGEFTEEIYWTTTTYGTFPNVYGGILLWERVYKGTYTASNGVLTLTYKSGHERLADTDVWNSKELPQSASVSYKIEYNADTYEKYFLVIEGLVPPCEQWSSDSRMRFRADSNYDGPSMGHMKP